MENRNSHPRAETVNLSCLFSSFTKKKKTEKDVGGRERRKKKRSPDSWNPNLNS